MTQQITDILYAYHYCGIEMDYVNIEMFRIQEIVQRRGTEKTKQFYKQIVVIIL